MVVKIAQWRRALLLLVLSQLVILVVLWCHHGLALPGMMVNDGPGTAELRGRNITAHFHVSLEQQVVHWESIRLSGDGTCNTISAAEDVCHDCNTIKVGPELFTIRDAWNSFTSLDCLARDVHHGKTGISARFLCPRSIGVTWRARLEHNWNFVRVFVSLHSTDGGSGRSHLKHLSLLSVTVREQCGATEMSGNVKGSPILLADSRYFMSAEHPLSEVRHHPSDAKQRSSSSAASSQNKRLSATVAHLKNRHWPPSTGKPWRYSAAIGVITESSQARREFLGYLDVIRPAMRWQRPLLHYNSWYDMHSWADESLFEGAELKEMLRKDQMSEESCLRRIKDFKVHLGKRNVTLDSFLWNDGWDDPKVFPQGFLGAFDKDKFPRGFTPIVQAAHKEGADGIGVWLSPWGGYGATQRQRLEYGKQHEFETNANGFSLAGPKYYEHFRQVVMKMREDYGVNLLKFDGLTEDQDDLAEELEAMMALISELRAGVSSLPWMLGIPSLLHLFDLRVHARLNESFEAAKKDPWINLNKGTWPSPYFLLWVDSIWRGGSDLGEKRDEQLKNLTRRQRWIVWREWQVCKNVAQKARFFPLAQLMIHGVVVGGHGQALVNGLHMHTPLDFAQDVWSFLAMGFQLQELYLSPQFLIKQDFNVLGEALRWSRLRAAVLRDAHWVLGDFKNFTPYGAAAWKASSNSTLTSAHESASVSPTSLDALGILLLRNPLPRGQLAPRFSLAEVLELPAQLNTSRFSVSLVRSLSSDKPRSKSCIVGKAALPVSLCTISAGEPVVLALLAFEVLVLEFHPLAIKQQQVSPTVWISASDDS